jgi:hypothetical protein
MREEPTAVAGVLREIGKPRAILFLIAALFFLSVPYRFGGLCMYNWAHYWWFATEVMLAALALWVSRPWSYLGAMLLSSPVFYDFALRALKMHGVIRLSPAEAEILPWKSAGGWWRWLLAERPDELALASLAWLIFIYAAICLVQRVFGRRPVLT